MEHRTQPSAGFEFSLDLLGPLTEALHHVEVAVDEHNNNLVSNVINTIYATVERT